MSVSFAKLLQSGSLPPNELVSPRSTKVLYVFFFFFFFVRRTYISLNKQEEPYREPAKQDKENN